MKVALYYPWIYLKSGVERTILETVKRSKHEYTIFTNHYDKKGTYHEFKNLKVLELRKIPVRRNIVSVLLAAIVILFQKIDLRSFDLFMVHSEGLGDLILFRNAKIPTICYCHTPLRPVFDNEYKKLSLKKRSLLNKIYFYLFSKIFKFIDRYLWQKYDLVIFNSQESLKRARNGGLLVESTKHNVIYPGIDTKKNIPSWKFENYFLAVGRIMWTKNIELAIRAFEVFEKRHKNKNFKLIIAGQVDQKSNDYFQNLQKMSGKNTGINFFTNPDDKKIQSLYRNCYAFLATAFNEDFGLTIIEANSYGKPVIAVNSGGFKESQINGTTGFLVNATPNNFADKMLILARNRKLTNQLGKNAREHSKLFDWNLYIKNLDGVMEERRF